MFNIQIQICVDASKDTVYALKMRLSYIFPKKGLDKVAKSTGKGQLFQPKPRLISMGMMWATQPLFVPLWCMRLCLCVSVFVTMHGPGRSYWSNGATV